MERSFDQTAEGWDAASGQYASLFAPHTAQFADDVLRFCGPGAGDAVLELAAGSGAITEKLAEHAKSVVATDISPGMIELIRRSASPNVTAQVMDAQRLEFADGSFDGVYCMFGIMFFSDRARALHEIVRVLKPGGKCVLVTWHPDSRLLAPIRSALEKVMPGSPPARALQEPPVLGTVEGIEAELAPAGFAQIEVCQVTHSFEVASKEVYVRDFPQANPMGIMMQKMMPPAAREALAQQIGAELAAEFSDGPVRLAGVANIARARR